MLYNKYKILLYNIYILLLVCNFKQLKCSKNACELKETVIIEEIKAKPQYKVLDWFKNENCEWWKWRCFCALWSKWWWQQPSYLWVRVSVNSVKFSLSRSLSRNNTDISVSASRMQVTYVGVGVKSCIRSGWIRKQNWIRLSGGVTIISSSLTPLSHKATQLSNTTQDEQNQQMQVWMHEWSWSQSTQVGIPAQHN